MTPQEILRDLCDRYGLAPAHGEKLLPLVERALKAPPEVRRRLLELVGSHLEREASRGAQPDKGAGDEHLLRIVAKIVHPWSPPEWLMRFSKSEAPPGGAQSGGAQNGRAAPRADGEDGQDPGLQRDAG